MLVLIIDDAPVLRASFARIASDLGHTLAEATTLGEARTLVAQLRPDAIVVDGRLGETDVVALVAELCTAVPTATVLVVAALEETALVRTAMDAGARGALLRPFSRTQISERLRQGVRASPRGTA